VSSIVLTNEATTFSHESKVCPPPQNLTCDLRLSPQSHVFSADMPIFHRPSNKISDLRSVETPPAFPNPISARRFFLYHLGCCCFFHSPTRISFLKGYSKVTSAASLTMGYCYSCLLYNFHPCIPNNQNVKLLNDQNAFKTNSSNLSVDTLFTIDVLQCVRLVSLSTYHCCHFKCAIFKEYSFTYSYLKSK